MVFLIIMGVFGLYFCFVDFLTNFRLKKYGLQTKGVIITWLTVITPLAVVAQILYSLGK